MACSFFISLIAFPFSFTQSLTESSINSSQPFGNVIDLPTSFPHNSINFEINCSLSIFPFLF
uniref:Uncharacterized protein n=1 Tax=Siphoviridae sp. ctWhx86 TaxID=2826362 RepID=A0A8S5QPV8_9CAUD|nr:MAG TPA: hypothetical protein [Siphoviridae sp. ctWhx86]